MNKKNKQHAHNHLTGDNNLLIAFFLNISFVLVEIIGGIMTNSISILSDAIHDLGDSITILIAYFLDRLSTKSSNNNFTYGYKRVSLIGALLTSIILIISSCLIIISAFNRLTDPQVVNAELMLVIALFGIAINSFGVYKVFKSKKMISRAIMLHLLEDVLGWIAIFISSIFIIIFDWYVLDPLLSIVIAIFILYNAIKNAYLTTKLFMDKVPDEIDFDQVSIDLNKIDQIESLHCLKIWTTDGIDNYLTCHVVLNEIDNSEITLQIINKYLKNYNIKTSTIQFESQNNKCNL